MAYLAYRLPPALMAYRLPLTAGPQRRICSGVRSLEGQVCGPNGPKVMMASTSRPRWPLLAATMASALGHEGVRLAVSASGLPNL